MSDHPQEPGDWDQFPPGSNQCTDIVGQPSSTQGDRVIVLPERLGLADLWNQTSSSLNSGDLSSQLANNFPDIFFQTFLPAMTSPILQPTPAVLVEYGESSRGKRKIDDETMPELDRSQSEDIEAVRARESEIKQLQDTSKRSRSAETHNMSERRRRSRINDKIQALGALLPNCKKTDKASILDEAIVYLRSLKFQVEMMSMGRRPPSFMLPAAGFQSLPQQMPYFTPFLPMRPGLQGIGAGFGTGYPMFGYPSATFHTSLFQPPDLSFLQALNQSITLQQLPETAAESIPPFPASFVPERTSAFNFLQPHRLEFGESSSQNIPRISTSAQSVPIINQGFIPFTTSYTVHATHVIPPPNVSGNLEAEAPEFDEEGRQR